MPSPWGYGSSPSVCTFFNRYVHDQDRRNVEFPRQIPGTSSAIYVSLSEQKNGLISREVRIS